MNDRLCDVVFLSVAHGGGVRKVNALLADGFAKRGYRVGLASVLAGAPFFDEVDDRIQFFKLPGKRNPAKFLLGLKRLVRQQPKLIFCSQDQAILPLSVVKALGADTAMVGIIHNNPVVHLSNRKWIARRLPKFLPAAYGRMDELVAVSQQLRDHLVSDGFVNGEIQTIYNPVVDEEALSQVRGIEGPRTSYIVSAGNFNEQKDFLTLVRAFSRISDSYAGDLVILGDGPLKDKVTDEAKALGIMDRIELPGFVNNPFDYFKSADLFVLSSRWEGFGNVVVEAMAVGCPVVATDCPYGPREILDNGKWGLLASVADPEDLAAKMRTTLSSHQPAAVLIDRALQFSVNQSVANYEKLAEKYL